MRAHLISGQRGFTLVELAVTIAIIGVLIGAGFTTLRAHLDNAHQNHTMNNLLLTKRAMLDYVAVNKHMPCPDTDSDGSENRTGNACTASVGTVPFNDIGLGIGITRDDYRHPFAYGINTDATTTEITNRDNSASYFSNVANNNEQFPAFRLSTPPTSINPLPAVPGISQSYTVCKQSASSCSDSVVVDIEVNSIPAVIVAFNENGNATSLSACNGEAGKEAENCDGDMVLWKSDFNSVSYDDQMVTISGYEIKQQVDLVEFTVNIDR
ncbi:MAG: type II secretion system protein [Thiotrichales bacterium]|nr:type II secretion system protein [Thiotrichales bacterium]